MVMMYVTVNRHNTALEIAEAIMENRLSNHINIIASNHCKIWKAGKVQDSIETLLLIKTKALLFRKIEKKIKELHLEEHPKIFSVPITQFDDDYYQFSQEGLEKV